MILGWTLHKILHSGRMKLERDLIEDLEDYVKDKLADAKEKGLVDACGCEGYFRVEEIEDGYHVFIEVNSSITQYIITLDRIRIGGGDVEYKTVERADVIENYDGWQ